MIEEIIGETLGAISSWIYDKGWKWVILFLIVAILIILFVVNFL